MSNKLRAFEHGIQEPFPVAFSRKAMRKDSSSRVLFKRSIKPPVTVGTGGLYGLFQ